MREKFNAGLLHGALEKLELLPSSDDAEAEKLEKACLCRRFQLKPNLLDAPITKGNIGQTISEARRPSSDCLPRL